MWIGEVDETCSNGDKAFVFAESARGQRVTVCLDRSEMMKIYNIVKHSLEYGGVEE